MTSDAKAIITTQLSVINDGLKIHNIPGSPPYKSDTLTTHAGESWVTQDRNDPGKVQPKNHRKALLESVGDTLIYHRIWVEPLDISAGFITEEAETSIYIWNAQYGETATIESVDEVLPDGTQFTLQDADCPIEMGADAEVIYVVTVEKPGPPIQDTYYTITIEGIEYEIYVHGTRVIPLDQEPDWSGPPRYKYRFQTVLSSSPTYQEQRRALTNRMLRDAMVTFTIQNNLLTRFMNDITYGHDKVFGVPIYSETSILSTAASSGDLTIFLNDANDYHWNLNNLCTHLIIMDWDNDVTEIKEVDTVNSTSIVLARELINNYSIGTAVLPCFFASLKAIKQLSETDNTQTINIEFSEFLLGSSS